MASLKIADEIRRSLIVLRVLTWLSCLSLTCTNEQRGSTSPTHAAARIQFPVAVFVWYRWLILKYSLEIVNQNEDMYSGCILCRKCYKLIPPSTVFTTHCRILWDIAESWQAISLGSWRTLLGILHRYVHYSDVIMGAMASQITSLTIVYSTVNSGANQRKHQSSASLAFVQGIHRWPVNSPHKWQVTRKCFHLMTSPWSFSQVTATHLKI